MTGLFSRRLQQSLHVGRRRGQDHLEPGEVHEHRIGTLRVLRGELRAAADGRPEGDREFRLAAEHVVDLGGLVDDLVHGDEAEGDLSPVADRAHAGARRADCHAGHRALGDRRRPCAHRAELLGERRNRVGRQVEDRRIAPHLLGDRREGGLRIGHLGHGTDSLIVNRWRED